MKIAVNEFAYRQDEDSEYSHYEGSFSELVDLVEACFANQVPGYRDGVVLVSVPPEDFRTPLVDLKNLPDGAKLNAQFVSRREGEEPHLKVLVGNYDGMKWEKSIAKKVDIVLYRHDVLAENNEQSTDANWEIVSINASPDEKDVPMTPMTRARNILEMEGGTSAKLEDKSKEELIELIKEMANEIVYWNQHALLDT